MAIFLVAVIIALSFVLLSLIAKVNVQMAALKNNASEHPRNANKYLWMLLTALLAGIALVFFARVCLQIIS